ncbi:right-handed parallel beta-helix repeat-containing protein [Fodinicola feengrottensis]|uniref:hypothetical protein n=1 Tax=Fodinicola feengrottensis TaxID=435914 RepID=UPI002442B64F|nr:hypothetical protein [Fodinicola feengrottensis]
MTSPGVGSRVGRGLIGLVVAAALGLFGQWPAASFVRQAAAALPPYGTDGRGNPQSTDCQSTVTAGQSIDAAIGKAAAGAVVCVKAGDYSGQTVHLNRSKVTVRSNGVAKIKNAVVTGAGTTLDGFTVVGAAYLNPEAGIDFAGSDQKIVHNLVNGRQLAYGIRCDPCHRSTVSRNTVTNLQNYGLFVGAGAGAQIHLEQRLRPARRPGQRSGRGRRAVSLARTRSGTTTSTTSTSSKASRTAPATPRTRTASRRTTPAGNSPVR